MENPVKNSYLRRWTKGFHIKFTFHTRVSQSCNPWKTSSCKTTQNSHRWPQFFDNPYESINPSLWPAVLKSNVNHQECTAGPCSSDILHSFEQSKLYKCIFWIWTLQIFTVFGLDNLLEHLSAYPLELINSAQVKVQLPSHFTPDPVDVSLV